MNEVFAYPVISLIVHKPFDPMSILLQKRTKQELPGLENLFELPQGRMRMGEPPLVCAARELSEETGLVNFRASIEITTRNIRGEQINWLRPFTVVETGQHSYFAMCLIGTAEGEPRASSESSSPNWYSKREVLDLISEDIVFPLNVAMLLDYFSAL